MTDKLVARLDEAGVRAISTDLWGLFFEDISYSADGGLNSDLVQNGAFEYSRADNRDWSNFTAWRKPVPAGSFAAYAVRDVDSVAVENPHYARVEVGSVTGGPVGLENIGFDGMVFRAGETYHFSAWLRDVDGRVPVRVELVGDAGETLAVAELSAPGSEWSKVTASLAPAVGGSSREAGEGGGNDSACGGSDSSSHPQSPAATAPAPSGGRDVVARQGVLRVLFEAEGVVDVDFVTLEPATTYKGLEHFRPDLVEALDGLHPRFMRFPGGCITHGLGMDNMYHWDRTIGGVEHRPHNFNVWGYHQSFRIGYYEYLRLCETIGCKPLPVLPAGVSCQNTSQGPVPVAQEDMPAYIDEVLALIDFCNADPADNEWAAKRAAMGHPEPFGLEYLGIGNEDLIDPVFVDRFEQIFEAVKKTHPEITVVGTVGPAPAGADYEAGWAYARKAGIPIVDEHSYQSPSWWFTNHDYFDQFRADDPKVYLGEYSAWGASLLSALAEASVMMGMERNGDAVVMASYAPLFSKVGHSSWDPDLIYFDNEQVLHPYSYWVQQIFAANAVDTILPAHLDGQLDVCHQLSDNVGMQVRGKGIGVLRDITVETADGMRLALPDVSHPANAVIDTGLSIVADEYRIHCTVEYQGGEGQWGLLVRVGDVSRGDCVEAALGRGKVLRAIRDGQGSDMVDPIWEPSQPRAGTTWDVTIYVRERGRIASMTIDGKPVLEGEQCLDERRRFINVGWNSESSRTVLRFINATEQSVDVDCAEVLAQLGLSDEALRGSECHMLAGADPRAGEPGQEAPGGMTHGACDLSGGRVSLPAWSLSSIVIPSMPSAMRKICG